MKRLLACVMAVLLVFSMSGCAQDTSKQDAETVVTKYYDQLKKVNLMKRRNYVQVMLAMTMNMESLPIAWIK